MMEAAVGNKSFNGLTQLWPLKTRIPTELEYQKQDHTYSALVQPLQRLGKQLFSSFIWSVGWRFKPKEDI